MDQNLDIFHIMKTMRPMRRLKPDPVPQAILEEILDAAVHAPNSLNTQPYTFIVVRDVATKTFFGEKYHQAMHDRFSRYIPAADDKSAGARNFRTAMALGGHIPEVPVLSSLMKSTYVRIRTPGADAMAAVSGLRRKLPRNLTAKAQPGTIPQVASPASATEPATEIKRGAGYWPIAKDTVDPGKPSSTATRTKAANETRS